VLPAPGNEYRQRLSARTTLHAALSARDARLSMMRLVTFAFAVVVAIAAWNGVLSWWWLLLPAAAFGVLIQHHDRVIRDKDAAARAMGFYERGLARIEDRWSGTGEAGERFRDDRHLYANDLDLFGRGSLFELLSIARTRAGEETLAAWLTRPSSPSDVRARQQAVTELTLQLDLREELALAGTDVRAGVDTVSLTAWAEEPRILTRAWLRPLAWLLSGAAIGSAAWWAFSGDPTLFLIVVFLEVLYSVPRTARAERLCSGAPLRAAWRTAHGSPPRILRDPSSAPPRRAP
jgi:hypothetical protein